MKKLLNISLPLVVLILFGTSGCEKQGGYQDSGIQKAGLVEGSGMAPTRRAITAPPANAEPVVVRRAASVRPRPMVVEEPAEIIISKIYPAPEFAIIQMDKTMPGEVGINKPFDYSINIKNLTNATLTNVVITEEFPEGFKYTSSDPAAKKSETNKVVWEIESLEPRGTRHITVTGLAVDDTADSLNISTSVVTHFVPASASIRVIQPRLELAVTIPSGAILKDTVPVKYVVSNSGTGSARGVRVVQTLPDGLKTSDGRDEVVFDAGTLASGQSRQFIAKLKAIKTGKFVSTTVATAVDIKAKSQEDAIFIGQPVLVINKTGPEKEYAGRPVTYAITVANKGDAPAKNTVVEDTLPPGVTSMKATEGAKLTRSKNIMWKLGTLPPDASAKVRVSYVPNQVGQLTDTTTATAHCAETVTSSMTTTVVGIAGLSLEVVDMEDPVVLGSSTTYVIRVVNQGSAPGTDISIVCKLEDNVRYVSSTGATAGTFDGNELTFAPLATLAPKAKATWRVVVQAQETADTRFEVIMTSDQLSRPVSETESTHLFK